MSDKYQAVWLSHSSIGDFLHCPRLYYYRSVYRNPLTGHKITIITPPLALGQAVHEVVESLSVVPVGGRLKTPLLSSFEKSWEKVTEDKGGFRNKEQEEEYKERGREMLSMITQNPGPILKKAIKINDELPHYWLSEEENFILCGKIDWLEYLEERDSIHVIDFKTGKHEEKPESLQLPIYYLLANNVQKRKVERMSYWYLRHDREPRSMPLPDIKESKEKILTVGRRIKLARQLGHFKCPENGCKYCIPYEQVEKGKAQMVNSNDWQDIFIIPSRS